MWTHGSFSLNRKVTTHLWTEMRSIAMYVHEMESCKVLLESVTMSCNCRKVGAYACMALDMFSYVFILRTWLIDILWPPPRSGTSQQLVEDFGLHLGALWGFGFDCLTMCVSHASTTCYPKVLQWIVQIVYGRRVWVSGREWYQVWHPPWSQSKWTCAL